MVNRSTIHCPSNVLEPPSGQYQCIPIRVLSHKNFQGKKNRTRFHVQMDLALTIDQRKTLVVMKKQ